MAQGGFGWLAPQDFTRPPFFGGATAKRSFLLVRIRIIDPTPRVHRVMLGEIGENENIREEMHARRRMVDR